jgi:hypothetical protein
MCNKKGNIHHKTCDEANVKPYFFFNIGGRDGGWLTSGSDRFTPGKDPVSIV